MCIFIITHTDIFGTPARVVSQGFTNVKAAQNYINHTLFAGYDYWKVNDYEFANNYDTYKIESIFVGGICEIER